MTGPKPPIAKRVPQTTVLHGETRTDDYAWLRDKDNPEVIAYLEAENAYTEAVMKPAEALQKQLYDERQIGLSGYIEASEKKFQVRLWPSTQRQWDTFLNVIKVYDAAAPQTTLVRSEGGTAEGVLLARAGQADALEAAMAPKAETTA